MGCTHSASIKSQMAFKSKQPLNMVAQNPVVRRLKESQPLSERQRFLLCKSWKGISRDMSNTGVNMFARLFETNEHIRLYFKCVNKAKHIADIRENQTLMEHALMVMRVLDDAISSFDDIDSLVDMLLVVGGTHIQIPDFNANFFMKITEPFLTAVKDSLGDRYSINIEDIYTRAIHFILTTLQEGYNLTRMAKESHANYHGD